MMSQFYEQELPELTPSIGTSNGTDDDFDHE